MERYACSRADAVPHGSLATLALGVWCRGSLFGQEPDEACASALVDHLARLACEPVQPGHFLGVAQPGHPGHHWAVGCQQVVHQLDVAHIRMALAKAVNDLRHAVDLVAAGQEICCSANLNGRFLQHARALLVLRRRALEGLGLGLCRQQRTNTNGCIS